MRSILSSAVLLLALIQAHCAMPRRPSCTSPQWVAGKEYCAAEKVSHKNAQYQSTWCTQQEPGTGAKYDGWKAIGSCSRTSTPTKKRSPKPPRTSSPPSKKAENRTGSPSRPRKKAPSVSQIPASGSSKVVAYFAAWKVYHGYFFKNVHTSGSAAMLTHILYAFGGIRSDGTCYLTDPEADTDRYFTSENSVDGSQDKWDQPLRGNFNQILQLKKKYPHLKVLFSFGGWTLSSNFGAVSRNPGPFAKSCYNLVFNNRWKGVFDGIDIDWEYPNACGLTCDSSGRQAYSKLLAALRKQFGDALVTSAITADGTEGGKIDAADYFAGSKHLDFMMVMTYDYFGAWAPSGPTAPHAPIRSYSAIPMADMFAQKAIHKLKKSGIPSKKLLLGIGFYGRGWTGVTQRTPGGSATGPAKGEAEPGVNDYKVLKPRCPPTGRVAGTSYAFCAPEWWSYDTPSTVRKKAKYAARRRLGGMFAWELSGDTEDAEMLSAMAQNTHT